MIYQQIQKVIGGNAGALTVLKALEEQLIERELRQGLAGLIRFLYNNEITGSRLWMLYNDVCKRNIAQTSVLLHATAQEIVTLHELNHAIDNHGEGLEIALIVDIINND